MIFIQGDENEVPMQCEHCGATVTEDSPLKRVAGFDDRVCPNCIDAFLKGSHEPKRPPDRELEILIGMQQVESLAMIGQLEQAVNLLREIFNKDKKSTHFKLKGNPG